MNTQNSFAQNNLFSSSTPSSSTSSFSSFFSNFDWKIWLGIIFILAFLGINIFMYLGKGTQTVTDIFGPVISYFGSLFGSAASTVGNTTVNATKQAVNVSATGTKTAVDAVAGTTTAGLDATQQAASNISGTVANSSNQNNESVNQNTANTVSNNSLNKALSNASSSSSQQTGGQNQDSPSYEADDSYSSIQASKTASKTGWCYIGEDRGFRSCINVGENDTCMSGDIFPSQEICVNPSLRS